jgi:hypothetical protein
VKRGVIFSSDEEEDEDGDEDDEDEAERSLRTMMDVNDGALSGYFHSLAHSIASVKNNINVHTLHCFRPSHPRTSQPPIHYEPILSVRRHTDGHRRFSRWRPEDKTTSVEAEDDTYR